VIPRADEDGFGLKFAEDYRNLSSRDDLDSVGRQLRNAIELE